MLRITGVLTPEFLNLVFFLYSRVPTLMTNGKFISSETCTQQGYIMSNLLFTLSVKHVHNQIKNIPGLRAK